MTTFSMLQRERYCATIAAACIERGVRPEDLREGDDTVWQMAASLAAVATVPDADQRREVIRMMEDAKR